MEKTASIITIGNEILKGRTVNTNFALIGRILTFSGYRVRRGYICEDSPEEISEVFRDAVSKSDLVVSSGGLGPTFDDMTVDSVA
ncbi:MAG: molybdopterin-binding protein, partial [Thermoplasmataceae archaeon]